MSCRISRWRALGGFEWTGDRLAAREHSGHDRRRARADEDVPTLHGVDGADHFGHCGVLDQIAHGARSQALGNLLFVTVHRQHDHLARGQLGCESPRRVDPVQARHRDVHEHDVGAARGGDLERLAPVNRLEVARAIECALEQGANPRRINGWSSAIRTFMLIQLPSTARDIRPSCRLLFSTGFSTCLPLARAAHASPSDPDDRRARLVATPAPRRTQCHRPRPAPRTSRRGSAPTLSR